MIQSEDLYIQRCRIAAKFLFRYCNTLKISLADSPYYDLRVEDSRNEFVFGVKVVCQGYEDTEEFKQEYLLVLENYCRQDLASSVPIALLSLDETTETGKCGVVLSIRIGGVRICYPPAMKEINDDNFSGIMNDIIAADRTIRPLYDKTYGVLKTLSVELRQNRNCYGRIMYKRSFSETYKMNIPEVTDVQERFHRSLHGMSQSEYPCDVLDSIILSALQEKFDNVTVNSSLLLFNSELRDLKQMYSSLPRKELVIQIEPKIDSETMALLGSVIPCPRIYLTLFIANPWFKDNFRGELITMTIDPGEWPSVYESITLLKPTLTDLSKIID